MEREQLVRSAVKEYLAVVEDDRTADRRYDTAREILADACPEVLAEADAMREALRRLGDLADAANESEVDADALDAVAATDPWHQDSAQAAWDNVSLLRRQLRDEAVAARDLYAPKESGQDAQFAETMQAIRRAESAVDRGES